MKNQSVPVPTEAQEQECLMRWAAYQRAAYPQLSLLIHIPNEGKRSVVEGAMLKRMGLRPGVPDLILPVSDGKHNCLFIEMKRTKKSRISPDQKQWIDDLNKAGCKAMVCYGWEDAAKNILKYIRGECE